MAISQRIKQQKVNTAVDIKVAGWIPGQISRWTRQIIYNLPPCK